MPELPKGAKLFVYQHPEYYDEDYRPDVGGVGMKTTRVHIDLEIVEDMGDDDPLDGVDDMDQWLRDHTGYMDEYEEVKINQLHGPVIPSTRDTSPGVSVPNGPWVLLKGIGPATSHRYVLARFEGLEPQGQHPSAEPERWRDIVSDGGPE